jgi:oleate hydratase
LRLAIENTEVRGNTFSPYPPEWCPWVAASRPSVKPIVAFLTVVRTAFAIVGILTDSTSPIFIWPKVRFVNKRIPMSKPVKCADPKTAHVYLVGSGIASLAAAKYLIDDAGVPAKNIHILEQDDILGGALDGAGEPDDGFVVRGGRMHEAHYTCYWDLLCSIPSFGDPAVSVTDESFEFNKRFVSNAQARLLRDGEILDVSSFGLSLKDQADLLKLTFVSEKSLGSSRIEDWFTQEFFETNFWYIWTSMFAFQKWSSIAEMRRYMKRFIHLVSGLNRLGGVMRTKYNQYHSVVVPMVRYLTDKGVEFSQKYPSDRY